MRWQENMTKDFRKQRDDRLELRMMRLKVHLATLCSTSPSFLAHQPFFCLAGDEGVRRRGQQVSASNRIRSIIRRMRAHSTMYAVLLAAFLTLSCGASLHGSSAALAKGPPASGGDLAWVEDAAEGCLRGKVAVVTGATQGIGLEVARLLAGRARADLVMACRNMTACSTVAAQIRVSAPPTTPFRTRITLLELARTWV